jgi:hypothetical protein
VRVAEALSVGIGGRYWYMQTRGLTHFEDHIVGFTASPQPVEWKVQNDWGIPADEPQARTLLRHRRALGHGKIAARRRQHLERLSRRHAQRGGLSW